MQTAQRGTVVTVRSLARSELDPEQATVHLAVAFDGHQRGPVLERCTQVAAKVRASLEALGDPERAPLTRWSQAQTQVFSDRPWNAEGQRLALVYHARAEFTATFSDFAELGAWIAATSVREGLTIDSIEWGLTPATEAAATAAAQVEAVTAARGKAEQYAKALGLRIVSVLEIADAGLLGQSAVPPAAELAYSARHAKAMADQGLALRPEAAVIEACADVRFLAEA